MPEIRIQISADERAELLKRARSAGKTRLNAYVRDVLFSPERPIDSHELHALLAAKARDGDMRAIGILARALTAKSPLKPAVEGVSDAADPFAEVDELAARRRSREG